MRTTLTIDDDLMRQLKEIAHRQGLPLKQVVNRALRFSLEHFENQRPRQPYRCPTFSMGSPAAHLDLDKALAIAAVLEDEEVARKLELRK